MSTLKTEAKHAGHFIVSEANKTRSREVITVAQGEILKAGSVIAKHPTSGKYYSYDNDGTTTTRAAAAILFDNVDATDGAVKAVAIVRDAEVNGDEIFFETSEDTGDKDAAIADLKLVGIICRFADRVT